MSKRILMYRWKAYNYLDIKKYFEFAGFWVDEIWQKLESYDIDPEFANRIEELLSKNSYEFVFTVNYFALISKVCHDKGILYVSWSCDNPLISMHHESVFYDTNCIFSFDKANYLEFKDMGVSNIHYLPLAVDVKRIDTILKDANDLALYENEISFVGSLYERNSYDRIEPELPDYLRGYFEALMHIQSDLYGSSVVEDALTSDIMAMLLRYFKLEKSEGSFSDLGLIFSTTTLGFKIAQIERISGLNALSTKFPVSIYSNSDTSMLKMVQYKGSLDYWTEMPKAFKGSKLNLNFTIPNIKSGIPLRVWDILGSGGFLLTNFQAETPMYFEEGKDLVSFFSRDDMVEKAGYYLSHESEREKIRINGYEKVKELHTYEIRMKQLMDVVKNYLN